MQRAATRPQIVAPSAGRDKVRMGVIKRCIKFFLNRLILMPHFSLVTVTFDIRVADSV
jgi:hypothetical protein